MRRWLSFIPLLSVLTACNVASVREAPNTVAYNECQSNLDCGEGGFCDSRRPSSPGPAMQCRSRSPEFQKLLFEVTPPADGSAIAGVQFLIPPTADLGAGEEDISLALDLVSQVVGRVTAKDRKCTFKFVKDAGTLANSNDSSVPARVSLIPSSSALGLYSPRAVVQSKLVEDIYWGFSANVPPGNYDIYIEPKPQSDETCAAPPQLLRGKRINPGTVPLDIDLPEPSTFEFHVAWPDADGKLDGWMVDMLDAGSGRVISNRVQLALTKNSKKDYQATLAYSSVTVVDEARAQQPDQLLRLSPPDGSPNNPALPTVLMARSGLGLFAADAGTLTDFSLPRTVHVHGQVTSGITPLPVAATVTLAADAITGIAEGVLASFTRTVSVGLDGQFDVYLPPGKYRVSTVPQLSLDPSQPNVVPLAADTREWLVPSTPEEQAGKVIELGSALPVYGQVVDVAGAPVATAQVQASASTPSIHSDLLQETLDSSEDMARALFVPRASAGGVGDTGDFALKTDPGTFDVTVRPNSDTGFAWLVMPSVPVTAPNGAFLGRISMPLPVSYRGTVTMPGTEGAILVPGALVRAYIYVKDGQYTPDALKADSVLQVAETRAGNDGVFDILIPATLNARVE